MAKAHTYAGPFSDKLWRHAIMRAVNRLSQDKKTKHLDILAHRLIKMATEGDVSAMKEIGNRLDGMSAQSVTVSGDKENPLQVINEIGPELAKKLDKLTDA